MLQKRIDELEGGLASAEAAHMKLAGEVQELQVRWWGCLCPSRASLQGAASLFRDWQAVVAGSVAPQSERCGICTVAGCMGIPVSMEFAWNCFSHRKQAMYQLHIAA